MSTYNAARSGNKQLLVSALHFLLSAIFRVKRTEQPVLALKRVLILSPTHTGDIVIATSLLAVLKSAYPGVEIGFTTASWAHNVVKSHPLVAYTHVIDHWRMSREKLSLAAKVRRYLQTRNRALKEIRSLNYEMAICIHPGSIDFLNLCWKAGIADRVAFSSSFWAPLATRITEYDGNNVYRTRGDLQADLLRQLKIDEGHFVKRSASLADSTDKALHELSQILGTRDLTKAIYCVIHIGAGVQFKEMPPAFWREMAMLLSRQTTILFTGRGARECAEIERIISGCPNCINACDRLSWDGFVAAIRKARTVYGVDSMAGHVAAAVGTPCQILSHGAAGVSRWRPDGKNATVWTNPTPCSPCNSSSGCSFMSCLPTVSPAVLLQNSFTSAETPFKSMGRS